MMQQLKKIDPLYVLLLSIAVLFVSIVSFNKSKINMQNSQDELINLHAIASNYSQMKKDWGSSEHTIKIIDNIITSVGINTLDKKITEKKITIKIDKLSLQKIDKFVNKILNEKLNILKLNISGTSLELEVGM